MSSSVGRKTSAVRRSAARIGGLSVHIKGDSDAIARRARKGLLNRFRREALALQPGLRGTSLERKIDLIRRRFYARLALQSAKARARRARRRAGRRQTGGSENGIRGT